MYFTLNRMHTVLKNEWKNDYRKDCHVLLPDKFSDFDYSFA